jgi:hypothetical protein
MALTATGLRVPGSISSTRNGPVVVPDAERQHRVCFPLPRREASLDLASARHDAAQCAAFSAARWRHSQPPLSD